MLFFEEKKIMKNFENFRNFVKPCEIIIIEVGNNIAIKKILKEF